MKTIKDWLNTIADKEIREKALRNHTGPYGFLSNNLDTALAAAFVFSMTLEGFDYWNDIMEKITNGTLEIIVPEVPIMQKEDWNDIANGRNRESDYGVWASPDKPRK